MPDEIIDELVARGVSGKTIVVVAKLIADAAAADKIRNQTRERVQRHRDRKRNVTLRNATVTLPPSAYIEDSLLSSSTDSEKKKERKNTHMPKSYFGDFFLDSKDQEAARKAGWDIQKQQLEFERFRDHAHAHNSRYSNWHAAWRNWVSSPYQKPATNGNGGTYHAANPTGKTCSDVIHEMLNKIGDDESRDSDGLLPED